MSDTQIPTLTVDTMTWRWQEPWGDLPPSDGFAHHDVVVRANGEVVIGDAGLPRVHWLTPDGQPIGHMDLPVSEVHGFALDTRDGHEVLWVADVAKKAGIPQAPQGQVILADFEGRVLTRITADMIPGLDDGWFSPTAVAVEPGTGAIWVADGYGQSRVHKFTRELEHVVSLDGSAGAGLFKCPHWIHIDQRRDEPELYIADRANDRLQVYSLDGVHRRSIGNGEDILRKPSAFAAMGEYLLVAELRARVAILDADDQVLGYLGDGETHLQRPGWPNALDDAGEKCPPPALEVGRFNSPHGIAATDDGTIYVSEWLLGGRRIKLVREE